MPARRFRTQNSKLVPWLSLFVFLLASASMALPSMGVDPVAPSNTPPAPRAKP